MTRLHTYGLRKLAVEFALTVGLFAVAWAGCIALLSDDRPVLAQSSGDGDVK